jgi:transcriptional regulator with GAF, ATPase, and Fis domain
MKPKLERVLCGGFDEEELPEVIEPELVPAKTEPMPYPDNRKNLIQTKQRTLVAGNVFMEQSYKEFTIEDMNVALDMLMDAFGGKNVLDETAKALMTRAVERSHGVQANAARILGVSARMVTYYKQKLKEAEGEIIPSLAEEL